VVIGATTGFGSAGGIDAGDRRIIGADGARPGDVVGIGFAGAEAADIESAIIDFIGEAAGELAPSAVPHWRQNRASDGLRWLHIGHAAPAGCVTSIRAVSGSRSSSRNEDGLSSSRSSSSATARRRDSAAGGAIGIDDDSLAAGISGSEYWGSVTSSSDSGRCAH
jgi:hypothetical protein